MSFLCSASPAALRFLIRCLKDDWMNEIRLLRIDSSVGHHREVRTRALRFLCWCAQRIIRSTTCRGSRCVLVLASADHLCTLDEASHRSDSLHPPRRRRSNRTWVCPCTCNIFPKRPHYQALSSDRFLYRTWNVGVHLGFLGHTSSTFLCLRESSWRKL